LITILFVHGTGVRTEGYLQTLGILKKRLVFPDYPDLQVEGCIWGQKYGALRAGKSIFRFAEAGGSEYTAEDERRDTWQLLAADPMAGMRFLSLNREPFKGGMPGVTQPGQQLESAVDGLFEPEYWEQLRPVLEWAQIGQVFPEACERLKAEDAFKKLTKVAGFPLDPYRDAIAEALVALSIDLVAENGYPTPYICLEEKERVRVTAVIRDKLGGVSAALSFDLAKSIGGAVLRPLSYAIGFVAYAGNTAAVTPYLNWRRGSLTETATPIAGDILLYQCRGDLIRNVIRERLEECHEECRGPIVLLAHSLGGVACVDLLLDPRYAHLSDRVKLLITVGSQAPYFYEIGALHSLPFDGQTNQVEQAFVRFPRWLNLHNRRDFLSYIGAGVFPGRVADREVTSRRIPFPESHSAYFTLDATYTYLHKALRWAFGRPIQRAAHVAD
jgi:hypothetical protein